MSLNEALPLAISYFLMVVVGFIVMNYFVPDKVAAALKTTIKPVTTLYNLVQGIF